MIPPISGMQAIAAATFEGNPVDVDFGPGSGPAVGGGGGGVGSSSGMTYIHKTPDILSSNLDLCGSFSLSLGPEAQYHSSLTHTIPGQEFPSPFSSRFYVDRSARRNGDHRHPRRNLGSSPQ